MNKMLSLHTDGRWIKDSLGQKIAYTGTTEAQTSWRYPTHEYWGTQSDPVPMAEKMAELGVPWVRVCIDHRFWINPIIGPPYKDIIDKYVQEFTARNVYCIVGLMSHDLVEGDEATWLSFLTELANRYKGNPGMCGIFIYNEPQINNDVWRQWARLGAEAVHNANPELLILVHSRAGYPRYVDGDYWLQNPIGVPNIVWVYHDYFWQNYYYDHREYTMSYLEGNYELAKQQMDQSMYDRYFKFAVEYGMCIMNEEFGFNNNVGASPADMGYSPGFPQCMHDYLEIHNKYFIPWNEYAWFQGGYPLSDGTNLIEVGEIWVQYLHPPIPPSPYDPLGELWNKIVEFSEMLGLPAPPKPPIPTLGN